MLDRKLLASGPVHDVMMEDENVNETGVDSGPKKLSESGMGYMQPADAPDDDTPNK